MKRLASILLAAAALGSCSKGNDTPIVPTPPAPAPQVDYIAKIEEFEQGKPDKRYEISFAYDAQKRLSSFVETYPQTTPAQVIKGTLSYSDEAITLVYEENKTQEAFVKPAEYRLALDAKGKASKLEETHYDGNGSSYTHAEENYSYNGDGQLVGYKPWYYDATALTWQNGDMTKVIHSYRYMEVDQSRTDTRTYTSTTNRSYPDLNLFLATTAPTTKTKDLWSDQLGLRSTHLLSSFTEHFSHSGSTTKKTFAYKLDAKGRPTEVALTSSEDSPRTLIITYLEK
nr:hypothetical protein [uncultured Porphyromonas sp.]